MNLGLHSLPLFALAVFVLNATPGVDVLYTVSRTLAGGWRLGLAAALGISAGCLVHTLLAASGLAAMLAAAPGAFDAIKWAGAGYLVWLGLQLLRAAWRGDAGAAPTGAAGFAATLRQGFVSNVLNPKVVLFFLAFLPQFITPAAPHKSLAFVALGLWFVVQSFVFLLALIALVRVAQQHAPGARWARPAQAVGGLLFIGLAARLAGARA